MPDSRTELVATMAAAIFGQLYAEFSQSLRDGEHGADPQWKSGLTKESVKFAEMILKHAEMSTRCEL